MAYLAVNENGTEVISEGEPIRDKGFWHREEWVEGEWYEATIEITKGTIEKIIGKKLSWDDEPVEF